VGQTALVESQIMDGQRVVEALAQKGIDVTVAFWAKTSDDGWWYLYLATPAVDKEGITGAYRLVLGVVREMPPRPFGVETTDIKLLSPQSPMARDAAGSRRDFPRIASLGSSRLGGVGIDAAYILPALAATKVT
jgi:hypothetical protein